MSLLWQIGEERQSYLFGTMHIESPLALHRLQQVKSFLMTCEVFAAEFNLQNYASQPAPMPTIATRPIPAQLSSTRYRKTRQILLKSFGVDLDHLQYWPPLLIVNLLAQRVLEVISPVSLDEFLNEFALRGGKTIRGVETYEEQLAIFSKISMEDQLKSLLDIARNPSGFRKHLRHLIRLYHLEDIREIYRTSKQQLGSWRKPLLYQRNVRMAARIAEMVETNNCFVAIGAAHLAGAKGVLRLLKMNNVKVRPMEYRSA